MLEQNFKHGIFKEELKDNFLVTYVWFRLKKSFIPKLSHAAITRQLVKEGIEPTKASAKDIRNAVINIRQLFGHSFAGTVLAECRTVKVDKIGVKNFLHAAVYVVGKSAHVKSLYIARTLHHTDRQYVEDDQCEHTDGLFGPAENIHKASGKLPFKPRCCKQTEVVHKTRNCRE